MSHLTRIPCAKEGAAALAVVAFALIPTMGRSQTNDAGGILTRSSATAEYAATLTLNNGVTAEVTGGSMAGGECANAAGVTVYVGLLNPSVVPPNACSTWTVYE